MKYFILKYINIFFYGLEPGWLGASFGLRICYVRIIIIRITIKNIIIILLKPNITNIIVIWTISTVFFILSLYDSIVYKGTIRDT